MSNTHRIIASIVGTMFGLALPLMGLSGVDFMIVVYWTVVVLLFGAYLCQETQNPLTKKE